MEHTIGAPVERSFETAGPIRLRVELAAGDLTVRAGSEGVTLVTLIARGAHGEELLSQFTVEQRGSEIHVESPKDRDSFLSWGRRGSVDVEVDLPARSEIDVRLGSGGLVTSGVLGRAAAVTGSGDLSVDEVAGGQLRSGSGDVAAGAIRGPLDAKTGSGDVSIEVAGADVGLISGSGDVWVGRAEASLKVKTGSGDVTVGASTGDIELLSGTGDLDLQGIHAGQVRVKTGSGDVSLAVVQGVAAYLDLDSVTGDVDVDLEQASGPEDADATAGLSVRSGSGDIHVKRAQVSLS